MNDNHQWFGLASPDKGIDAPLANYSLTIGEASSLMHAERCKFASNRKVQRMCKDGMIDCQKITTTRNGQPVSEWLVNETSLRQHIETNEIKWDGDTAGSSAASGNASRSPNANGGASVDADYGKSVKPSPEDVAMPNQVGDASGGSHQSNDQSIAGDAMATPDEEGDASDDTREDIIGDEIGESRSLASVLIENARLTAQLQGTENLIEEIRDDKQFLREELIEARAGRKDVTAIAQRMLETLESISLGGKLTQPSQGDDENGDRPLQAIPHHEVPVSSAGDNEASATDRFQI